MSISNERFLFISWTFRHHDTFKFRNTPVAFHRESLSRPSLTISEYCPVVAFKNVFNDWPSDSVINIELRGIRAKHQIESEEFRWALPVDK